MTRYVISDLHLDHANILDYCDRPFDDVDAMNEELVARWNETVDPTDTVFYLGDLAWWDDENVLQWAEQLNGSLLLVLGNHDEFTPDAMPFPVVDSCTLSHAGQVFVCQHYPEEVPENANWWLLHGHCHNNDTDDHPFIDPTTQRINVSVELTEYRPIPLDVICDLIKFGERFTTISDAPDHIV